MELNKEEYEEFRRGGTYKGKKKTTIEFDRKTMDWQEEIIRLEKEINLFLKRVRKENRKEVHVLLKKIRSKNEKD